MPASYYAFTEGSRARGRYYETKTQFTYLNMSFELINIAEKETTENNISNFYSYFLVRYLGKASTTCLQKYNKTITIAYFF